MRTQVISVGPDSHEPATICPVPSEEKPDRLTAVSLFSGAGGFCAGVQLDGWKVVCAVESDPQACMTYAANFGDAHLYRGDIADFLPTPKVGEHPFQDLPSGDIDVVYGGPPCQGFSLIGPRDPQDPRNRLYKEFVRVVRQIQPRAFVMENVPNMLSMRNGCFKERIKTAFRKAGYSRTVILTALASDYFVPQNRKRVFVLGLRNDLPFAGDFPHAATELLDRLATRTTVSVREAIMDLPDKVASNNELLPYPRQQATDTSDYQKMMRLDYDSPVMTSSQKCARLKSVALYNHHTKGIRSRRMKILKSIRPGECGDSLPAHLWKGVRGHKWRRLHPEKPSHTILAQMHRDLSEWIHPLYDRWITVREAARLQSFHDGFVFCGSETQQLKQVGNAVPPLLALAVARAVSSLLRMSRRGAGQSVLT